MSTRATVKVHDENETYYLYCGHDGFPENIEISVNYALEVCEDLIVGAGYFAAALISCGNKIEIERGQNLFFELTTGFHGDESYLFEVVLKDKFNWEYSDITNQTKGK
jgi:hypothetical protein